MNVISESSHPLGRHYVAELDNGHIMAGLSKEGAKEYDTKKDAIDDWIFQATETCDHSAWNICYMLED